MAMPFWRPEKAPPAGVVLAGGLLAGRDPDDDDEGDDDERREDGDVQGRAADGGGGVGRGEEGHGQCSLRASSRAPRAVGQRVELAVGPARVDERDGERRDELAEAEEQADRDVADHAGPHEPGGEHREQDVEEVPGEEERGRREDEPAELAAQLLELRSGLQGEVRVLLLRASVVAHGHLQGLVRAVRPGSDPRLLVTVGAGKIRRRPPRRAGPAGDVRWVTLRRTVRLARRTAGRAASRGARGMMGPCAHCGRSRQVPVSSSSTSPSPSAATRTSRSGCCGRACAAPTSTSSSGTSGPPPRCRCR